MRRRILIVIGVFVVCLMIWFIVDQSGPKEKVLSTEKRREAMAKILDREPVLTDKKETAWKVFDGKFVSFSYPADAIVHTQKTLPPAVVESFQCSLLSERLNLTVQVTEGQTLSDHAGIKLRENQPLLYHKDPTKVADGTGFVFSKETDEGVEMTSFVAKNGRLYSFSVTGYQLKKVAELYNQIVASASF